MWGGPCTRGTVVLCTLQPWHLVPHPHGSTSLNLSGIAPTCTLTSTEIPLAQNQKKSYQLSQPARARRTAPAGRGGSSWPTSQRHLLPRSPTPGPVPSA